MFFMEKKMSWEKIGVVVTFIGVVISYQQLNSSISSNEKEITVLQQQLHQAKQTITAQAVDGYLSKPQLINAKKIINTKTNNGRDYSSSSNPELESAILSVLNYLETLATGVTTGIYDDSILCKNLKRVVRKQVEVHILGQRPTGVEKTNSQPFSATEFTNLVGMNDRWSKTEGCGS